MKPTCENYGRKLLSMAAASLIIAGVANPGRGVFPQLGIATAEAAGVPNDDGGNRTRRIRWDVAMDCRTWRNNGGIPNEAIGRGDGFIADGRMFPAGTLPPGVQSNDPNDPGSIGSWVERGTMAATVAEIVAGARPAFFATWYHTLNDGSMLVADGPHPESGPMAVIGGTGRFSGASGELADEIIGWNSTGCPNMRVTVTFEKRLPK